MPAVTWEFAAPGLLRHALVFPGLLIFLSVLSCGSEDGIEPVYDSGKKWKGPLHTGLVLDETGTGHAWCQSDMGHSQEPVRDSRKELGGVLGEMWVVGM